MTTSLLSDTNNKRYTLPSNSFVNPSIVRFMDKSHTLPDQQYIEQYDYEEEEDTTTVPSSITSSPLMTQRSSPPQPTASTSLDHLWSKQERYDNLELRLFSLEESEKRFERRLQSLEKDKNSLVQPMKPDQQQVTADNMQNDPDNSHDDNKNYMQLYHSLLEKYNALEAEFKKKEMQYEERIQELLKSDTQLPAEDQKPCYKEEDGYLLFDTKNMNGEIIHCKVKIPPKNLCQRQPPKPLPIRRGNFITTTLTSTNNNNFMRMRSSSPPQHNYMNTYRHITSPKTNLNPNAPEWKKKDSRQISFY